MLKLDRPTLRITFAVIVVAAAFLLRQILVRQFGIILPPFITLYPAVIIVALLAGFWAGLLATVLAGLLAAYWIFAPTGRWTIESVSDIASLIFFMSVGALFSVWADHYGRNLVRLAALEKEQELRETKAQLQQITDDQRTLINALDEGLAVCEMIFDDLGTARDYRILEVNKAYEKQTGLRPETVQGKTALEVFPSIEKSWIEILGKVATTGVPERFENFNHNTGKYYETFACSAGGCKLIVLVRDISERKRAKEQLSESRKRLQLLLTMRRSPWQCSITRCVTSMWVTGG